MVGNDVVDLLDRDSDPATLNRRFDERVFAEPELLALSASRSPELRWRLWSAKEAAYKAVKRLDPHVVFSPSRFRVDLARVDHTPGRLSRWRGVVESVAGVCTVCVEQRDGFVHALACVTQPGADAIPEDDLLCGARRFPALRAAEPGGTGAGLAAESRVVREFTARELARLLGCDEATLEIRKTGRLPELWRCGEPAPGTLSLSHHGDVVGFAFAPRARAETRAVA